MKYIVVSIIKFGMQQLFGMQQFHGVSEPNDPE